MKFQGLQFYNFSLSEANSKDPIVNLKGAEITIGKFDGLHLGHQMIFNKLQGTKKTVVSFFPAPQDFLNNRPRSFIMPIRLWLLRLEELKIDNAVMINFNANLSKLDPETFIKLLTKKIPLKKIIVGSDFLFGKNAKGNINLLKQLSVNNFEFEAVDLIKDQTGNKHGSSKLRELIKKGNLSKYKSLTNNYYSILGKIMTGKKLGRQLGFPTANVKLDFRQVLPSFGVYAVKVKIVGEEKHLKAVANLGLRPTINDGMSPTLEVHILNFSQDIYHKNLLVEFVAKIRGEIKFSSLDALKQQIKQDCQSAIKLYPDSRLS